jgi:integrase
MRCWFGRSSVLPQYASSEGIVRVSKEMRLLLCDTRLHEHPRPNPVSKSSQRGIKWADIELSKGTARIRRALVRHKKTVQFEEPKTARSRRTVYLPQPIVQKLKAHKRKQGAEKLKFKGTWGPHYLVFCSVEGTPLSIPNLTSRYFRPILTAAGLPQIRLYDLRHSCATLL